MVSSAAEGYENSLLATTQFESGLLSTVHGAGEIKNTIIAAAEAFAGLAK